MPQVTRPMLLCLVQHPVTVHPVPLPVCLPLRPGVPGGRGSVQVMVACPTPGPGTGTRPVLGTRVWHRSGAFAGGL